MTSFELTKEIEHFLQNMSSNTALLTTLQKIVALYDTTLEKPSFSDNEQSPFNMAVRIRKILRLIWAGQRGEFRESERELEDTYHKLIRELEQIWSRKLFSDMDNLEAAISRFEKRALTNGNQFFVTLRKRLDEFASTYEEFIKASYSVNVFELLKKAKDLQNTLSTTNDVLIVIKENLSGAEKITSEAEILDLFLQPDTELTIIVIKLKSLDVIYSELCRLLNVSLSEYPLRVIKLESGSLWAKLFGESKVITLMTDLIRSGVGFIYRNFTKEGKLASIPMSVEEIEAVLNLEQRMRESGLDTTDMRESIRISGVVIAKQLNNLLTGEATVTINNQLHSVGSEMEKLFIEQSKTLLLEEGESESTT